MGAVSVAKRGLLAVCLALPCSAFAKEEPLTAVADLRYGVALYHYFQEEHITAFSELLLAKQRGGVRGHGDNPDIMEGGFALAYGMDQYAGDIFERVLEQNRPVHVRDAAWFYLARMRYQQGDWYAAEDAANRISAKPAKHIANELTSLRVSTAIKQGDLARAESILAKQQPKQGWLPYLYFNLGSAWARQQNYTAALAYYSKFEEEEFKLEEHRSLYDKAMTASGYSLLFAGRPHEAILQFSKVRLDSPLSSRALLGYGWAAAELDDYTEALKPWYHLSTLSLVDANTQEALVAVPYAYEQLGKEGLALEHFQRAEGRFSAALVEIDDIMANLQGDSMLEVLKISRSQRLDWLRYAKENQLTPEISYLVALFSREDFEKEVHELRDLLAIQNTYNNWLEKLTFYTDMLDAREFDRTAKMQYLAEQQLTEQINEMVAKRESMAAKIEQIKASNDYFALAKGEEADLIHRVERSAATIELVRDSDPFIDETEEAMRRYRGILLWNASRQFSDRLWHAEKVLAQLDETLTQVRARHQSIQKIVGQAQDISPYLQQLDIAHNRLTAEKARIDRALLAKQDTLRDKIYDVLETQRYNILQYLAQSRLSIARLYDKANKQADYDAVEEGQ
ncbi:tetratricopeptide repeat protein [Saccharophagus degradans]|uniref:tetratricopeptide repeat protein n=1 Tax=Saccharophagus degradans TaxID=86304 RepID=UPI001C0830C2|nr:tetratricopeptide repeat protein [Saccharophagus degradans]MBU2986140.1 tetratricopeptide repeat protein [Saccharophagus degradans]